MKENAQINIGSYDNVIPGFVNYDLSPNLLLSHVYPLVEALSKVGLVDARRLETIQSFRAVKDHMKWGRIIDRVPHPTGSLDVVYASHFLEHIDREDALNLLKDIHRALRSGGVVRIVVPDLEHLTREYVTALAEDESNDPPANYYLKRLEVIDNAHYRRPMMRLRTALLVAFGLHGMRHRWMWDWRSMRAAMIEAGFNSPRRCQNAGSSVPSLRQAETATPMGEHSLYVEAVR
ncbi:MAG: methyltransferase domain-containing protein [Myxococcales bacterium]|nr:methyltransferase domain-containing protein [Myxococcales bacterium]